MPRKQNEITVGTRGSQLATLQTGLICETLAARHPGLRINIKKITTKGDKITDVPLARIGGQGLFTKELENALLSGAIDIAVHSMKDVPTELAKGLEIAAIPKRVDPHDVLVSANGQRLEELPKGATIGSSSLRRKAQLLAYRPDLNIANLRGNLDTRLRKISEGEFDATILACAGLTRMGWRSHITQRISFRIMLPAAGQGALAIETRANDKRVQKLLAPIRDTATSQAVAAERAALHELEGGCQVPIGTYARLLSKNTLRLDVVVCSLDGSQVLRAFHTGSPRQPEKIAAEAVKKLINKGATEILDAVRCATSPAAP